MRRDVCLVRSCLGPSCPVEVGLLLSCLVASCLGGCGSDGGNTESGEALGLLLPLTGPIAEVGANAERVAQVALQEINEHGGVHGAPLALSVRDSQTDPDVAIAAARDLFDADGIEVMVTGMVSSVTEGVLAQVVVPRDGILLTGLSGDPMLSRDRAGNFYRTLPVGDEDDGWVAWWNQHLYEEGHRSVVYAYSEHFTQVTDDAEKDFLGRCQDDACTSRRVAFGDDATASDVEHALDEVLASPPDVLFLYAFEEAVVGLLRQVEQANYAGAIVVTDLFGQLGPEFAALLGPETLRRVRWVDAAPNKSADAERLAERFVALHGVSSSRGRGEYCTYDAIMIAALAMQAAGSGRAEAVRAVMADVTGPPGEVVGPFGWARALELLSAGEDIDYQGFMFDAFDDAGENRKRLSATFQGWDAEGSVIPWVAMD